MHWATDTEIECMDCAGDGWVVGYNLEAGCCGGSQWECGGRGCTGAIPIEVQVRQECEACEGTGFRAPTADELDNAAEVAYQRQFEGEPPLSQRERDEMQAKRDAQWGVK